MPRKDKISQRAYMRGWYGQNSTRLAALAKVRRETYRRRNSELLTRLLEGPCPGCGSEDALHREARRRELKRYAHAPCSEDKLRDVARFCDVPPKYPRYPSP